MFKSSKQDQQEIKLLTRKKLNLAREWNKKCGKYYENLGLGNLIRYSKTAVFTKNSRFNFVLPAKVSIDESDGLLIQHFFRHYFPMKCSEIQDDIANIHKIAKHHHANAYDSVCASLHFVQLPIRLVGEYCIDFETGLSLLEFAIVEEFKAPLVVNLWQSLPEIMMYRFTEFCNFYNVSLRWIQETGAWNYLKNNRDKILAFKQKI